MVGRRELLTLLLALGFLTGQALGQNAGASCSWVVQDGSITDNDIEGQCKQSNGVVRRTVLDMDLCLINRNGNLAAQAESVTPFPDKNHKLFWITCAETTDTVSIGATFTTAAGAVR
jgi:hypothetical protein